MHTNKEYYVEWRNHLIIVPIGTVCTHQTACGEDKNYRFVRTHENVEFFYAYDETPVEQRGAILFDVRHSGINVPKEYFDEKD